MKPLKDADYFQRRERIEMERADRAVDPSARAAHLGLAALYRRELHNTLQIASIEADRERTF